MNNFTYLKDIDFKEVRRYVGASDIPTLALMNLKYDQTPLTLWNEKTGREKRNVNNERMKAGKELEPIVLKWGLEKMEPYKNFNNDFFNAFLTSRYTPSSANDINLLSLTECFHPEYKFLGAHADLIETDKPFIMEAKTTGFFGGKRKDDINKGYDKDDLTANGIPSRVFLQVQTQMLCYDIKICYVSVMIDTGMHRLYGPIKAHKKTQENILALAERFWWHVENDKPPKPETWKDIIKLNPTIEVKSKTVIAGNTYDKVIVMKERAKKLRAQKKKIDSELKDLKNAVGLVLSENEYLEGAEGDGLAHQFEVNKYMGKNLKDMEKTFVNKKIFNKLLKDGFINKSSYRDMRF